MKYVSRETARSPMLPTSTRIRKMTEIRRRKAASSAQINRVRVARLIWAGVAWEASFVRVRSEPGWSLVLSMSLDGSDFLRPNITVVLCVGLFQEEVYPSTVEDGEQQVQCSRIRQPRR
jgi:hypothetical protein